MLKEIQCRIEKDTCSYGELKKYRRGWERERMQKNRMQELTGFYLSDIDGKHVYDEAIHIRGVRHLRTSSENSRI